MGVRLTMGRMLQSEFIKLKGSPMLWISLAGIAVAPLLNGLLMMGYKARGGQVIWHEFMSQNAAFIALLLGAPLFGLMVAYLFGREYAEDTLKSLLTLPVRREWVVSAKLVVLLAWSLSLSVAAWVISPPIGAAVGAEGFSWSMLQQALVVYAKTVLLIYVTLPLTAWIAMLARGYIPPLAFAIAVMLAGFVFVNSKDYGLLFPWSIPALYAISTRSSSSVPPFTIESWAVLGGVFILGVMLCLLHLHYADADK